MNQSLEKHDLTIAKGLGIFLVVMGHTLAGGVSKGNEWFCDFVNHIYMFHMPFFMFISGYVFFRVGRLEKIQARLGSFVASQAVRLLIPFFTIGLIVLYGKLALQSVMHVDNVPADMMSGLIKLFWMTDKSPSMAMWYVFVLFIYQLLGMSLFRVFKYNLIVYLVVALVLYALPAYHHVYMDRVAHFFVFFIIGGYLRQDEQGYEAMLDRKHVFWALPALLITALAVLPYHEVLRTPAGMLLIGALSIPALHALCRKIAQSVSPLHRVLYLLGTYSYSIYLLNTMSIGVTKGILFKLTTWNGIHFYYVIPLLIIGGLLGPLLAEKIIFSRIGFLRRHILMTEKVQKH
jgi:fucose 4-O-acetylase-like acetyltransferase